MIYVCLKYTILYNKRKDSTDPHPHKIYNIRVQTTEQQKNIEI